MQKGMRNFSYSINMKLIFEYSILEIVSNFGFALTGWRISHK